MITAKEARELSGSELDEIDSLIREICEFQGHRAKHSVETEKCKEICAELIALGYKVKCDRVCNEGCTSIIISW